MDSNYGQGLAPGYQQGLGNAARESTLGETVHDIENFLGSVHEIVQTIEDNIHGAVPRVASDRDMVPQPPPPPGLRNASLRIKAGLDGLRERLLKIAQAL